ncbi:MAG TPA: GNAT family N-acetyltransferase [Terriglobia bacterium]|nr:GNAT family N-acetyltransferase [Terriglobia bacterium]
MDELIKLVPYDPDYLELLCAWRKDAVVRQYNPIEDLSSKELHERFSDAASDFEDVDVTDLIFWIIQADQKPVGHITVKNINHRLLTAEIGYAIAPEARKNGYATDAVRLVTLRAFNESALRKLIAYVHEENLASQRVLEKVGYTAEGLLREHYIVNGEPTNEIIYGVLRREIVAGQQ